jgi:hypothetical protein
MSIIKTSHFILYREIIAVYSEIHEKKHIYTVCRQNTEFVNLTADGTYSDHWALEC